MNIVEFYRSIGVELTPVGTRWKSLCPFHRESGASFVVYPDGGYHCFGCGAHGTAKDIQEEFELDYRPFPDITSAKDPIIEKVRELKSKMEDDLSLLIVDADTDVKFKAYDMFDALVMDARAVADNIETTFLTLVMFMKGGYKQIFKMVKERSLT
jgi:DNA primase